jgi:cell division protease FtsH
MPSAPRPPTPSGGNRPPPPGPKGRSGLGLVALLVLVVLGTTVLAAALGGQGRRVHVTWSPFFLQQLDARNVKSIDVRGDRLDGVLRKGIDRPGGPLGRTTTITQITTGIPEFVDHAALEARLERAGVTVEAHPVETGSGFAGTLLVLLPLVLIIGMTFWLLRRGGGLGGAAGIGRSRARRVEPSTQSITFADVAGVDEAKAELSEIADYLRHPEKYTALGGHVPHGVLLTGPPGTGKTLLARALAGEAEVPFFSVSASEFVELYVGVGASRVRDLFAKAKDEAPAIVFIDELDAIGRSRSARSSAAGGNEEREQTFNQILTELDGFDPTIGVIVLSATNKPDVLDPALLRPGRFDRHVVVQPPDTAGRRAILAVHTRAVPLGDDVDLDRLASATSGMVGADLANVVNEGSLTAARRGHEVVTMRDLLDALERIVLGSERKILMTPEDRRRVAVHEAGHAVVAMLSPAADPVRKVSIVPHGAALGVTLAVPAADRFNYDRAYLDASIDVALGGRVAEELVFADVTTGAEDDIRRATALARNMVGRWGMSDVVGPVAILGPEDTGWLLDGIAPETRRLLDEQVQVTVEAAHARVTELLRVHRDALERLADALLVEETLDADAALAAAGLDAGPVVLD